MPRGPLRPTALRRIADLRDAIVEDACAWADACDEADDTDADRRAAAQQRRARSERRLRAWVAGLREALAEAGDVPH